MATDAGPLEVFYALIENAELVIQLAYEAQDPRLINQEISELHERCAAYRTALAQMTDQGSEMVFLPQGKKIEKLKSLTGMISADAVNALIFQVEQYFALTNMIDSN